MFISRKSLFYVLIDMVAQIVVQAFGSSPSTIDKSDIKKYLIQIPFRYRRPEDLRHLFENAFAG